MTIPQWPGWLNWLIYVGGILLTFWWLERNNVQFPEFMMLVDIDNYHARCVASLLWHLFWPSVIWYRLRRDSV